MLTDLNFRVDIFVDHFRQIWCPARTPPRVACPEGGMPSASSAAVSAAQRPTILSYKRRRDYADLHRMTGTTRSFFRRGGGIWMHRTDIPRRRTTALTRGLKRRQMPRLRSGLPPVAEGVPPRARARRSRRHRQGLVVLAGEAGARTVTARNAALPAGREAAVVFETLPITLLVGGASRPEVATFKNVGHTSVATKIRDRPDEGGESK